ncbi:helix-hairpin-helix domain-containing protein [Chloroflexota bacterium]
MKSKEERADTIKQSLRAIPGIGPKLTQKFHDIGIKRISDLKGKKPEELYSLICVRQGVQIDRCVLYVCRSSVYFAETENPDPEKLKWWYWKDKS